MEIYSLLWSGDNQEKWDLKGNICSKVAGGEIVEFVAVKIELFFHATDVGVGDVGLV
jgi:hypothetical protein